MRPLNSTVRAQYAIGRLGVIADLVVQDLGGTWHSIYSLISKDSIVSATWGEDIDSPGIAGSINLFRGRDAESLSPLISAGAGVIGGDPLVWPGRPYQFFTQLYDSTTGPLGTSGRMLICTGRLDGVDIAADASEMQVTFRDETGALVDSFIKDEGAYGPDSAQNIIAALISDWYHYGAGDPFIPLPITVPVDPGFTINQYLQQQMLLWDAIKAVAQANGYDLRFFRPDTSLVGPSRLTYYAPDRVGTTADVSFNSREYKRISKLSIELADIRNAIRVKYGDNVTLPEVTDAASIAAYGYRWAQLSEDKTTNIDTDPEATTLANSALADLKDPPATHESIMQYFPFVEINDYQNYEANGVHYDTDQLVAVVNYKHALSGNGLGETTIQGAGKARAANREWLTGRKTSEVIISTSTPSGDAPQGTLWAQVSSRAFP